MSQPSGDESTATAPRFAIGGVALGRFSYGYAPDTTAGLQRLGFGIRQAQLRSRVLLSSRLQAGLNLNLGNGTALVQTLFLAYSPTPALRLRFGRLPTPKPVSTPLFLMDDVDRAATETLWSGRTVGGHGHDFGLDIQYHSGPRTVTLMLHNGDGDWSRLRGDYTAFIDEGSPTVGIDRRGMAVSLGGAVRPSRWQGGEVGGFIGINNSRNPNTEAFGVGRRYASAGGYFYWGAAPGSQSVRVKLDVAGIRYETVLADRSDALSTDFAQHQIGAGLLVALGFKGVGESFVRAERDVLSSSNAHASDTYFAVGGSLSTSALRGQPYHHERLTLSYRTRRGNGREAEHLLVAQLQLVF